MPQTSQNTGYIDKPPRPTDWRFGAVTGIKFESRNPSRNWREYITWPVELQAGWYFDTFACVTYAAIASVEMQVNFLIKTGLAHQAAVEQLRLLGFLDNDNKFRASRRFTAEMSGTIPGAGNSFVNVWDSIRKDGIVPHGMWGWDGTSMTSPQQYYADVPQEVRDHGRKVLDVLNFAYEFISYDPAGANLDDQFDLNLEQAPVQIASAVCPGWNAGAVVQKCDLPPSHSTEVYDIENDQWYADLDSYDPVEKRLAPDYRITSAFKGVVTIKKPPMTNTKLVKIEHADGSTPEFGFYLPAMSPDALKDKGMNFGIPIPTLPDGSVNWLLIEPDITIQK